ncbi:MAG: CHASE2 domain-containing protein [Melioribacteraceae bacterium]|nr:CHASE2 domain-containing protein [Melioribacteraceae bacterium]
MKTQSEESKKYINTNRKKFLRIGIILFALVVSYALNNYSAHFNSISQDMISNYFSFRGADSNIVLITIDKKDFGELGGYPISRKYYALLINRLTALNVKSIGLEIFLSDIDSTRTAFDSELIDAIKKSKHTVLASVIIEDKYGYNSFQLPSPKHKDSSVLTGHVNYIETNGIFVPVKVIRGNFVEVPFAVRLAGKSINDDLIKINFYSKWKEYKKYSFVEFLNMTKESEEHLSILKGKHVIIGVTDSSKSKPAKTPEGVIPGLGLHAQFLDNLINDSYINYGQTVNVTFAMIAILLLLVFIPMKIRFSIIFLFYFLFYVIVSVAIYNLFFIEMNHFILVIAIGMMAVLEIYFTLNQSRHFLSEVPSRN